MTPIRQCEIGILMIEVSGPTLVQITACSMFEVWAYDLDLGLSTLNAGKAITYDRNRWTE